MSGSAADVVDYDPIQFYDDPYPIYRHLRDDAPAYHNRARGVWVLSRYDDIQTAARDWRTLVNGRGVDVFVEDFSHGPGDFLDMDPPRHDQLRHILRHDFAPKRIKSLEPFIRGRVIELIESLLEQGGGRLVRPDGRARSGPARDARGRWGSRGGDEGIRHSRPARALEGTA